MEFIYNYAGFLLKTITILVAILMIISALNTQKKKLPGELHAECINDKINEDKEKLRKKFKIKPESKEPKVKLKDLPKLFVLQFHGDVRASQTEQLRDEITAIINVVNPNDEVMVKVESPGGAVNGYGFAASQLERFRNHNIPLTVCIDQVAASGGYLMACIANHILAAPFAIIGSIGVVAQIPNLNKWLKKHDIDFEQITAGKFKRTLTMFGENTEEGRKKFAQDLQLIHDNFKHQVSHYRPQINIEEVATGEHWLAIDAKRLGLVDELKTSDDWLLEKAKTHQIITLHKSKSQTMMEKLMKPAAQFMSRFYV